MLNHRCFQKALPDKSFSSQTHPWLCQISNPPQTLFYQGSRESLFQPCFAIVGTRRPSRYGIRSAIYFARELASLGFTIVSGLARGIDSFAHRGALMAKGKTVAVLGHGLDRIYPAEHWELSQKIVASGGCLISEYPAGIPPLPHHFPERNRIISGFCLGILIVEAAEKSGSLITARLALEQNREVFVIPSRIEDQSFSGGNRLLQEGAKMVLELEDILEELPGNYCHLERKREPIQDELRELHQTFKKGDYYLSLGQIYSLGLVKREKLLRDLASALSQEIVIELGSQNYLWIN